MLANLIWLGLIFVLKRWTRADVSEQAGVTNETTTKRAQWKIWLWGLLGLSLAFRALFFGSIPIYEDDWNRYLWDGASVAQGVSPYKYSPTEILDQLGNAREVTGQKTISPQDGDKLLELSDDGYAILNRINNPTLTTIYPPSAQAAFALAAIVKPLNIDGLRLVFLAVEAITMFLLIKALTLYGRSPLWALLYAFNPLLIYSAFNVVHMDVVLPPFIIAALILIKRRPYWAGAALAGAAAVKVWPLMISELRPSSGLSAYSQNWQRSSFLFPAFMTFLETVMTDPGRFARLTVAAILTGLSLWFGFGHILDGKDNAAAQMQDTAIPRAMMLVTLTLLFLSPTGYPWYVIWVIMFMPFIPYYGAAMLCVLVPLYYVRFALGEQGRYGIYTSWLVPLQFGLPMLILLGEYCAGQLSKIKLERGGAHG